VRIASVGLPGNDDTDGALRFLRSVNWQTTLRGVVSDGFNTIRIAWSDLTLSACPKTGAIDYSLNLELKCLSSMQVMDKVVEYADTLGLGIIFDHHINDGGELGRAASQWSMVR